MRVPPPGDGVRPAVEPGEGVLAKPLTPLIRAALRRFLDAGGGSAPPPADDEDDEEEEEEEEAGAPPCVGGRVLPLPAPLLSLPSGAAMVGISTLHTYREATSVRNTASIFSRASSPVPQMPSDVR